jgi:hypothetical protein
LLDNVIFFGAVVLGALINTALYKRRRACRARSPQPSMISNPPPASRAPISAHRDRWPRSSVAGLQPGIDLVSVDDTIKAAAIVMLLVIMVRGRLGRVRSTPSAWMNHPSGLKLSAIK